jgi:hypothetical protein
MQVPLAAIEPLPKLGQNLLHRRRTQFEPPEVHHHVWLPAAIHAPPFVADEAEDTQAAMIGVIAALCRSAPLSVDLFPVDCAVSRFAKRAASRLAARLKRKGSHRDVCACASVRTRIRLPNCAGASGCARVRTAVLQQRRCHVSDKNSATSAFRRFSSPAECFPAITSHDAKAFDAPA